MTLDEERERDLKALLVDLKMMASRTTLTLARQSLLIEVIGWADGLRKIGERINALHLTFEEQATTSVVMPEDVPGQVVMHDLDQYRVPDFVDEFE